MRKKLLSLLLVALMVIGLLPGAALAADGETAAAPNIVLSVYDAEGKELSAGSKIETGDTVTVKLKTTAAMDISVLQAYIVYDPAVLQYNADGSKVPAEFKSAYFEKVDVNNGAVRAQDVDTSGLAEGTPIIICQYMQSEKRYTIPADSIWAEVSFTALKAADTAELGLAINEAEVLDKVNELDLEDIRESLVPQGTSLTVAEKQIPATGITLNTTATKITRGKTTTLKATVTPTDTTDTVTWESDNEEVATVDANGKVTGVAVGTAKITAKAGEQSATCEVTVEWIPVTSVTMAETEYTIVRGKTANITTTILPANASDQNKTYHSENEKVAKVAYGQITAVGVGTTEITVTVDGVEARGTVTVTEIPLTSVRFPQESYTVSVTQKGWPITLAVEPVNQTDGPDFQWIVEDPTVLTLTPGTNKLSPAVTGLKLGTTKVTMKVRDFEISCMVTVNNPVNTVTVKGDTNRMLIGGTTQLTATAKHVSTKFDPTDTELVWSSSAPGVASVDQNGLVTALSTGMTYIYATANNGKCNTGYAITVVSQADGSYTVTMPENETVVPGGTITLPVSITSDTEGVKNYSAYHMVFTYDPNALELTTTEIPGCTLVTKTAGKIEVIRYGAVQELGKAFDLTFNVKNVPGDTNVTLTKALVDISQNALASDAPAASVPKDTTTYHVSVWYDVTLPDGTNADSTKVEHGDDFTFRVTDYDPYKDYTFTAAYGDETTAEVTDNGDGSFTVKNVTGNLAITMDVKGKTFTVTLNPEEAEGASSATYGEDYTFTVKKADDGKQYNYDVWATIDGKDYKPTGPDENGKYTIPGAEIKGDITITVDKTIVPEEGYVAVKVEGTGKADVTAAETAKKNADFTFTVTKVAGYAYTAEISVGTETIKEDSEFLTYVDSADGIRTYTLKGEKVTNTLLITVGKVLEHKVNVTVSDRYEITAHWEPTALDGENYTFTVAGFKAVYDLRATVTENGETKEITIDRANPGSSTKSTVTCTVENVKGDLDIQLSFIANQDYVAVKVSQFVELDDKTVFLVATRTKPGFARSFMLDTYDGYAMYQEQNLYKDKFDATTTGGVMTNAWLVIVNKGESFTVDDALAKLTYTNRRRTDNSNVQLPLPVGSASSTDVNGSGKVDVNDAQLVYDIYNGVYPTFCKTNRAGSTYVEPQIGATMTKFLCADVNKDMKVDSTDAAALVALIK